MFNVNTTGGPIFDSSQIQCGGFGPKVAVKFSLRRTRRVYFWTDSILYDTVLHIRNDVDCANIQDLLCNDDFGRGLSSFVSRVLPRGTYYLVVDGYRSQSGSTNIHYAMFF